jgi:hypothetical protein
VLGLSWWRRVATTWYGHRLIIFGFLAQISKTVGGGRGRQCAAIERLGRAGTVGDAG